MPSIAVPAGYSYVLAAVTSGVWLNVWQLTRVGAARRAAGIKYPQLYAEKSEALASKEALRFNCVQRAHQNTLEVVPFVILSTLLAGLKYPILAASLSGVWVVGRVLYTIGYSTGDPAKRNFPGGPLSTASALGLLLSSTYAVYEFVVERL